jgi:RNA polymerase sigma factor (sigma-70 family)
MGRVPIKARRAAIPREHEQLAVLVTQAKVVRSYIRRRVADPHIVDDLISETYLVAWRRLEEVPDGDRAVGWLCTVAGNLVRNHLRGEARRRRLLERVSKDVQTRAESVTSYDAARGLTRLVAAEAWAELPPIDRQLLVWVLAGWSHEDIAAELDLRIGTVAMRLLRARNRLDRRAAV